MTSAAARLTRGVWLAAVALALTSCAQIGSREAFSVPAPSYRVGDRWEYRIVDGFRRETVGNMTAQVTAAGPGGITVRVVATSHYGTIERDEKMPVPGAFTLGAVKEQETRAFNPPLVLLSFPLIDAKTWHQWVATADPRSDHRGDLEMYGKVVGSERVRVPAGEFAAIKIWRLMRLDDEEFWRTRTLRSDYVWYVPGVKAIVREERNGEFREKGAVDEPPVRSEYAFIELVAFRPGTP